VIITDNFQIEATLEQGVLYRNLLDGREWVRPKTEFMDGRFESLNSCSVKDGVVTLKHPEAF